MERLKEKFHYRVLSYNDIQDIPTIVSGCMVLLCTCGSCNLVTGIEEVGLQKNMTAMFFEGSSLLIKTARKISLSGYGRSIRRFIARQLQSFLRPWSIS